MMDGAWKRIDPDPRPITYANKRGLEGGKTDEILADRLRSRNYRVALFCNVEQANGRTWTLLTVFVRATSRLSSISTTSTYLLGERQSSQYSRRGGKWDRGRKWAAIFPSALNLKVSRGFQQLSCLFGEVCFRRIKIGKASSISVGSSKEMECKLVGGILLFHFEYNLLPLIMSDLGRVTQ